MKFCTKYYRKLMSLFQIEINQKLLELLHFFNFKQNSITLIIKYNVI